jgi:hypothetical protein
LNLLLVVVVVILLLHISALFVVIAIVGYNNFAFLSLTSSKLTAPVIALKRQAVR